jgi:hypothetical protein
MAYYYLFVAIRFAGTLSHNDNVHCCLWFYTLHTAAHTSKIIYIFAS